MSMRSFKTIQPLILALLFVCISGLLLGWMWVRIDAYGGELLARMQAIEDEQAFVSEYNELIAVVESTASVRETLNQFILHDENDTIELLSALDSIAEAQRVSLITRDLHVVEKQGRYNDLALSFALSGNERAVDRMVQLFETLPYHGTIVNLTYERRVSESTGAVTVDAVIGLLLTIHKYDQ